MLAHLDALLAARDAGNTAEVHRLLSLPLSRLLSRDVAAELRSGARALRSPLRLLQLRHCLIQLFAEQDSERSARTGRRPHSPTSAMGPRRQRASGFLPS